ncbi:MAG TPA: dehydrogenase [Lentisphaeria bacterium]|nr:MAG: dehydrogenase [Lentisphaerae bacterium GWF2_49_21]HBC87350.1 dehydrogenase [Lentisphaeria bacterium]
MSTKDGKKKVRVGFVGVGGMGQCAHLRNYATLADCEVVALSEPRKETAKAVAQRYNIGGVYSEASEMIKKENLDALVASQPFTRHGVIIPELLGARIPVFIEKPLSSTIESGEKILGALKKSDTWIMVGYHKRSDPASMHAKKEIEKLKKSAEIGRMKYIRVLMPAGDWISNGFFDLINKDDYLKNLPSEPAPTDMDAENYKKYIGFVNYYIHQVNLIRYLIGESYKVTYADPNGVLLAGTSEKGIAVSLEMSPYSTTLDWQESALVCFEKGWVKLELPSPLRINTPGRVEIFKDPGSGKVPETVIPQMPWIHAMRQQAVNFVSAVRGDIPNMCDASEALEDLKVARQYLKHLTGK